MIKESGQTFVYNEWIKEKYTKEKVSNYFTQKNTFTSSSVEFEIKFKKDVEQLLDHAHRFRSQYRKIGDLKKLFQTEIIIAIY